MMKFYVLVMAALLLTSIIPFAAFITIPLMYFATLIIFPLALYSKARVSHGKPKAAAFSIVAFVPIYFLGFGHTIPNWLDQRQLCHDEGGITVIATPERWHKTIADDSKFERWVNPEKINTRRQWEESGVSHWVDDGGLITKSWSKDGKDYLQKIPALVVERETRKIKGATAQIIRLIDPRTPDELKSAGITNPTLASYVNFSANESGLFPQEFQFWRATQCSGSKYLSRIGNNREFHTGNAWKEQFNGIAHLFANRPSRWLKII